MSLAAGALRGLRRGGVGLALLALAACAAPDPEGEDPFRDAVAAEYDALYAKELALSDWNDWPRYRRLRDAALAGAGPKPDDLSSRRLSDQLRAELTPVRDRVARLLLSPAEAVDPKAVAAVIGAYECWVEEAEEGRDLELRDACRTRFDQQILIAEAAADTPIVALLPSDAPSAVEVSDSHGGAALLDAPFRAALGRPDGLRARKLDAASMRRVLAGALAAQPRTPRSYLIYFRSGGSEMTDESRVALAAALEDARQTEAARLSVFGHTDTVGGADANARVSKRRAAAIREVLIARGLEPDKISAKGFGERDLLIQTPDSTGEARNRRVEIVVQ